MNRIRSASCLAAVLIALMIGGYGCVVPVFAAEGQSPNVAVNTSVSVTGRLEFAGKNYFLDPRFVLVDDEGNRVYVSAWAPLELSPLPPQVARPQSKLLTMQDYLGRRLSITGVYRFTPEFRSPAGMLLAPAMTYIEVHSVTDVASGTQMLVASPASTTVRSSGLTAAGTPAEAQQPQDDQPTESPRPAGSTGKAPARPQPNLDPQPMEGPLPVTRLPGSQF